MANLRAELKSELEAIGAFEYRPWRVYAKAAFLLAVTLGLFAAAWVVPSWWARVPLILAGIWANIGLVMIGHDAGHGAVSSSKWVNDFLGYTLFTLIGGLPLVYWKWKHNTMHHSYPNVVGKDPDVAIFPYAMNREQRVEGGWIAWIQRHQSLMFWPLALLAVVTMRFDGLYWHLTRGRKLAPALDRWIDYVAFALHFASWLVFPPLLGVPFLAALAAYAAWSIVAGVLLAAIFLPAHMESPIYRGYDENFVLQLRTTQNLITNPVFSYLLIGLDHQIEHHLFQRMSHLNMKKASPIVRAFCARKGLPYVEKDWGAALWATTLRFDQLPHYELIERPPREDGPGLQGGSFELGRAEFTDGREPPALATGNA